MATATDAAGVTADAVTAMAAVVTDTADAAMVMQADVLDTVA
jgi:hypothetical protein